MSCTLICVPVDLHHLRLILWDNDLFCCKEDRRREGSPDQFLTLLNDFLNDHQRTKEQVTACVVGYGTSSASAARIISAIWSTWYQVRPVRLASCTMDPSQSTLEITRLALASLEDVSLTQLIPRYTRPAFVTVPTP